MKLRSLALLAAGAGLLFALLRPAAAPKVELSVSAARLNIKLDGVLRLDLPVASGGIWRLEARSIEDFDNQALPRPSSAGWPDTLTPPFVLPLPWQAASGGAFLLKNAGAGTSFLVSLDPIRNELAVVQRSSGHCSLSRMDLQPLHALGFAWSWAKLGRSFAGMLALAAGSLWALLVCARWHWKIPGAGGPLSLGPPQRGIVLAALTAFLLAVLFSLLALQRLPKSFDDVGLLFQARLEAQGHLSAPHPPSPAFFGVEGLYDNSQGWTGKQALLWPYLLGQGLKLRLAWLLDPILAFFCVLLTGQLALAAGLGGASIWAAWSLALSPFFVEMSASYLNMTPALLASLGAMLCLWKLTLTPDREGSGWRWSWLAMALLLFSAVRAYSALCAWGGASLWLLLWGSGSRTKRGSLVLMGFSLIILFSLLQDHLQTGHAFLSAYQAYDPRDHPGLGANVGSFSTWGSPGHDLAKVALNLDLYLRLFAERLNGWPGGLFLAPLLAGLWLRKADHFDRLLLCVTGAQVIGYAFYYAPDTIHGPRYWFELSAPLILLQARGIEAVYHSSGVKGSDLARGLLVASLAVLVGLGCLRALPRRFEAQGSIGHVEGRLRKDLSLLHVPQPALIFFANEDPTRYVEPYGLQDPWLQAPYVFARDQGSEQADQGLLRHFPGRRVFYWDGQRLLSRRWTECALPI